jgi:acyl carrier protein
VADHGLWTENQQAMTQQDILSQLNDIFIDVFDDEDIVISPDTTASDIEDWDSLSHTELIADIQKRFKIKFKLTEVLKFNNVGDMVSSIEAKLNPEG